ncbi:MAG: tetratricopeptide repeat protein [Gemmatimonadetes bacterium]|nr:tetratricopeptide repeat protein [Gemmatimonadota bacterium]
MSIPAAPESHRPRRNPWKALKDVDQRDVRLLGKQLGVSFAWGLGVSLLGAALFGNAIAAITGFAIGAVLGWYAVELPGRLFHKIYMPSGDTTPAPAEYSYAESLARRGLYDAAMAAYRRDSEENPEDPEPYLRIARLLRDKLGNYEEALTWFRRGRNETQIDPGREMLVGREIVEIYLTRLNQPGRAAPELARLAEKFRGTSTGEWARKELRKVKVRLREEL